MHAATFAGNKTTRGMIPRYTHKAIARYARIVWLKKNTIMAKQYMRTLRSHFGHRPLLVLLPANYVVENECRTCSTLFAQTVNFTVSSPIRMKKNPAKKKSFLNRRSISIRDKGGMQVSTSPTPPPYEKYGIRGHSSSMIATKLVQSSVVTEVREKSNC